MQITFSLQTISVAAAGVWQQGKDFKVWAFYGEMGAGKTTFIHALCEVLQVTSTVGSPTYSIINEYASNLLGTVFHMDWYRLADEQEALQAGVEEPLLSGNLCLVEWPERAPGLLPEGTLVVRLHLLTPELRQLILEPINQ